MDNHKGWVRMTRSQLIFLVVGWYLLPAASGFRKGKSYKYHYTAKVLTGLSDSTAKATGFELHCHLVVNFIQRETAVVEISKPKVYDIKSTFGGKDKNDSKTLSKASGMLEEQLTKQFKFTYHAGQVTGIFADRTQLDWIVNLKKGMANILSSNILHTDNSATMFTKKDLGIDGDCMTMYSIHELMNSQSRSNLYVTKVRDYSKCDRAPNYVMTIWRGKKIHPGDQQPQYLHKHATTKYQLSGDRYNHVINIATSSAEYEFTGFGEKGGKAKTEAEQKLELTGISNIKTRFDTAKMFPRGNLLYKMPRRVPDIDVSVPFVIPVIRRNWNRTRTSKERFRYYMDQVMMSLNSSHPEEAPRHFLDMTRTLQVADYSTTLEIFDDYINDPQRRQWMLDSFSLLSRPSSVCLKKDLVVFDKVHGDAAAQIISSVAYLEYLIEYQVEKVWEMGQYYEELLDKKTMSVNQRNEILYLWRTSWLTFSGLAYNLCKERNICPPKYVHVLRRGLQKAVETNDEANKIVFLASMGNAGIPEHLQDISQQIQDESSSIECRSTAIWALRRIGEKQEKKVVSILSDILDDSKLHQELHVVALDVLMDHLPRLVPMVMQTRQPRKDGSQEFHGYYCSRLQNTAAKQRNTEIKRDLMSLYKEGGCDNIEDSVFSGETLLHSYSAKYQVGGSVSAKTSSSGGETSVDRASLKVDIELFGYTFALFDVGLRMQGLSGMFDFTNWAKSWLTWSNKKASEDAHLTYQYGTFDSVLTQEMRHKSTLYKLKNTLFNNPDAQYSFTKGAILADAFHLIPTSVGMPLTFNITMTSVLSSQNYLKTDLQTNIMSRQIKVGAHTQGTNRILVNVVGHMATDLLVMRTGVGVDSSAAVDVPLDAKIDLALGQVRKLKLDMKKTTHNLVSLKHKSYLFTQRPNDNLYPAWRTETTHTPITTTPVSKTSTCIPADNVDYKLCWHSSTSGIETGQIPFLLPSNLTLQTSMGGSIAPRIKIELEDEIKKLRTRKGHLLIKDGAMHLRYHTEQFLAVYPQGVSTGGSLKHHHWQMDFNATTDYPSKALDMTLKWGKTGRPDTRKQVSVNLTAGNSNPEKRIYISAGWNTAAEKYFDACPMTQKMQYIASWMVQSMDQNAMILPGSGHSGHYVTAELAQRDDKSVDMKMVTGQQKIYAPGMQMPSVARKWMNAIGKPSCKVTEIPTMEHFDVKRFLGKWNVLARTRYIWGEDTWDESTIDYSLDSSGNLTLHFEGFSNYSCQNLSYDAPLVLWDPLEKANFMTKYLHITGSYKILYTNYEHGLLYTCLKMLKDGRCDAQNIQVDLIGRSKTIPNAFWNQMKPYLQTMCVKSQDIFPTKKEEPCTPKEGSKTYVPQGNGGLDGHECQRACQVGEPPKKCVYHFNIEWYHTLSKACYNCPHNSADCKRPDCIAANGISRPVLVVNRQMPGPAIQVCENDTVEVYVTNKADDFESTSIHWHGIHQRGTPYMDGVALITQCPINPRNTFKYSFKAQPAGTHYWHSHSAFQRADGLYGAFIVRQPRQSDAQASLYDVDDPGHYLIFSDWDFQPAMNRFEKVYHQGFDPRQKISALINGRGASGNSTSETPLQVIKVTRGKRYRLRLVNNAALTCPVKVTVDRHAMTIISADGAAINPITVDVLIIHPGERYDVVLHAYQRVNKFWIRFKGLVDCYLTQKEARAVLEYDGAQDKDPRDRPWRKRYKQRIFNPILLSKRHRRNFKATDHGSKDDVMVTSVESVKRITTTNKVDRQIYLRMDTNYVDNEHFQNKKYYPMSAMSHLKNVPTLQTDRISFIMPPSPPLSQFTDLGADVLCNKNTVSGCKHRLCRCTHTVKLRFGEVVELILVNEGLSYSDSGHPMHMHGYYFEVLAQEKVGDKVTLEQVKQMDRDGKIKRAEHPIIRDTVTIPSGGFLILRLKADNPGWWLFHCHVDAHFERGMSIVFRVGEQDQMPPIPRGFPRCGSWTHA